MLNLTKLPATRQAVATNRKRAGLVGKVWGVEFIPYIVEKSFKILINLL